MMHILLLIFLSCSLTACLPAIFTATTASTMVAAKDQPVGEFIDDVKIASYIKSSFIKNNFRELYTKIKVEVEQGRVLLTGVVQREEEVLKAVEISWDTIGVREVINELKVDQNSNYFDLVQYTKDSMITAQIKAKTFARSDIKFVNYTIVTANNVVYVFGMARSEEEGNAVADLASKIRGVEKVICHIKIAEPAPSRTDNDQDVMNDDT